MVLVFAAWPAQWHAEIQSQATFDIWPLPWKTRLLRSETSFRLDREHQSNEQSRHSTSKQEEPHRIDGVFDPIDFSRTDDTRRSYYQSLRVHPRYTIGHFLPRPPRQSGLGCTQHWQGVRNWCCPKLVEPA